MSGTTTRGARRRPRAGKSDRCQICGSRTEPGLDLGHQPLADHLVTPAARARPETAYPLQLRHCPDCGLTQLGYVVSPTILLRGYPFLSGTTRTAREHLQGLARRLVEVAALDTSSFVVDVGSNDGTLLQGLGSDGPRRLGVDPAEAPVAIASERGVPTIGDFFHEDLARGIVREHGQADAISAAGVFGHIPDLAGVMRGVEVLLAPEGVFLTENQYWLDMVSQVHYDNVFHEHLRYYSMRPLRRLYADHGLEVFDVRRSDVYGGSLTVLGCRRGVRPVAPAVHELLEAEEQAGLYQEAAWRGFAHSAEERRRALFADVYARVSRGQKVVGIGAPAKAATVCNYCRLGPEHVSYITEVNPLRIGMFLPGAHIPIVDEEALFSDAHEPDAAILFAWNYHDEIVPKLRERGFRGELLRP